MNSLETQQQLVDQRRGRYVRVSDVDRRQLIDAYKKGEDFIALARKLNIKRSTARSILRTFIDEGRVSAKQRAGTRLRFITEDEAEMIREMKRRHPLITIGQIQMRLQRTSNRVLSKASISRILTNSIRLGKRAKRSIDGQDGIGDRTMTEQDEFGQLSSDEGTGGAVYIDEEVDDEEDDDDDDDGILESNSSVQNLEDFQRFMYRKTSVNGEDSMGNDGGSWDAKDQYDENGYPRTYQAFGSEDENESSEMDDNEIKSSVDCSSKISSNQPSNTNEYPQTPNETEKWNPVKSEPVCVFLNQNFDSSDSEQPNPSNDVANKATINNQSNPVRRTKVCPICGESNFSRLAHHLTVAHNLNREESLTLIAYADRNNNMNNINTTVNNSSSITVATVSSSSPTNHLDKSPQPTPITINTNNQQIPSSGSSPPINDSNQNNPTITTSSSPNEQQSNNCSPTDGKKRLLCPRCNTWVLNLTDHLIKKHHLVSKQERLPFLRLARNRCLITNAEKTTANSFLISPNEHQANMSINKNYQSIIKKYRKKPLCTLPASESSSLSVNNRETTSMNSNQNLLTLNNATKPTLTPRNSISMKDLAIHQKFEQRLSVFRQQFAVTVAMQNSLMQQMELLQRSFVSIEEEWNDMKKDIVESIA